MDSTKNFAWPITAISKENYNAIVSCVRDNQSLFFEKKIMIFGAGIRGTEISVILESIGYTDIYFTDNNSEKWGGVIDSYPIISVTEAMKLNQDAVFMISVEEGDAICRQLESFGMIENRDYFFPKPNMYGHFVNEFKREVRDETLIMGDCMFEVVSFDDKNKDSLAEIFQKALGYENVKLLTIHGMGIPSFYHILKAQVNCNMIPRTLVLMINFETLTGKQHLLPRSQHTKLIKEIYAHSPDPDGELTRYVEITKDRVENIQTEFFTTNNFSFKNNNNSKGLIGDNASKMFLKLNYMYNLNPDVEGLQYLKKIMKLAKEKEIAFIPFLPPVNYERGTELFGEKFEESYQKNFKIIHQIITEQGFSLLDLSHICKKEQFAHITTPDETTNYEGRAKVAACICAEIEKLKGHDDAKE